MWKTRWSSLFNLDLFVSSQLFRIRGVPLYLVCAEIENGCSFYLDSSYSQTSQLFQCQPTSDPSGRLYTPNIPNFYFNDVNAAAFRIGSSANLTTPTGGNRFGYIFTIPADRDCTGSVVALQYCYQAKNRNIGDRNGVFKFAHLTRNGHQITLGNSFDVQTTPQNDACTAPMGAIQQICCATTTLSATNRFQIPSPSYTFAIILIGSDIQPLQFAASATEYRYEHFQMGLGTSIIPGNMLTLDSAVTDESLLLLRFIIGKCNILSLTTYNY